MSLLEIKNLTVHFDTEPGVVRAVDGVSFSVGQGETIGIIGESGCGKTTLALSVLGLVPSPPGRIVKGEVIFKGQNLVRETEEDLRRVRGSEISLIFQNPFSSLNPVFSIGSQVAEAVMAHRPVSRAEAWQEALRLLELVEIPQVKERLKDYPHQFSGGMRQRVMIAMALSCNPQLLIADEPTTALDVTTQAQILELIGRVQAETGAAAIIISHDLGVVAGTAQQVLVMYAGRVVEQGPVEAIYYRPQHPYTKGLLNSVASLALPKRERVQPIEGSPPSLVNLPPGCAFSPRCPDAKPVCSEKSPNLKEEAEGYRVACHLTRQTKGKQEKTSG